MTDCGASRRSNSDNSPFCVKSKQKNGGRKMDGEEDFKHKTDSSRCRVKFLLFGGRRVLIEECCVKCGERLIFRHVTEIGIRGMKDRSSKGRRRWPARRRSARAGSPARSRPSWPWSRSAGRSTEAASTPCSSRRARLST